MNLGEIRVFRFKRAKGGAEAISTNLRIDASAQLVIIDEKMPLILDVFGAHGSYRNPLMGGDRPHREPPEIGASDASGPARWPDVDDRARQRSRACRSSVARTSSREGEPEG
jgi:hypothetical protein